MHAWEAMTITSRIGRLKAIDIDDSGLTTKSCWQHCGSQQQMVTTKKFFVKK